MKILMDFAEVFVGNMDVNLGGHNVGVAKESLDWTQIGAVA